MLRKVDIIILAFCVILPLACTMLISSPNVLVVDGRHNIAYAGAINQIYGEGLQKVSDETARLANAYIADQGPKQIVLLDPTPQNVKDFYELAQHHNAQLIIGSASNETELKSQLFELGLDNKKVQLQTNQDWDPDNYENIGRGYTY